MAKRRLSRWLAPVALIVVVGAILAVINNSDVGGKSKDSAATGQTITGASAKTKSKKHRTRHHTYVVRSGDTLSAIAEKTGIPLDVIEQLNPDLDAQTLHAGQKIKLVASS